MQFGGAKRDRTADLLHAMQALSQLSYSPTPWNCFSTLTAGRILGYFRRCRQPFFRLNELFAIFLGNCAETTPNQVAKIQNDRFHPALRGYQQSRSYRALNRLQYYTPNRAN